MTANQLVSSQVFQHLTPFYLLLCVSVTHAQLTSQICRNDDVIKPVINVVTRPCEQHDETVAEINLLKGRMDRIEKKSERNLVPSSCARWYAAGMTKNGYVKVDPGGEGGVEPFLAYCNMSAVTSKGIPTQIHHDVMSKRHIDSQCRPAQCFTQVVNYMATKEQIEALLRASSSCSQYIRYDCHHSLFHHDGARYTAWFSRDGDEMTYWGGADPGATDKCACGMTNSCDDPSKSCNCDLNDRQWRADDGYLTDKNTLPVSKIKFGDLDESFEKGAFALGPLVCWP